MKTFISFEEYRAKYRVSNQSCLFGVGMNLLQFIAKDCNMTTYDLILWLSQYLHCNDNETPLEFAVTEYENFKSIVPREYIDKILEL